LWRSISRRSSCNWPTCPKSSRKRCDTGLAPQRLELEITETALISNREGALAILEKIRALGVHISMDDFGTGYSSLSSLQSFPFSKLKIDQSFVARALTDAKARSIIRAVVGLGRSLGLPVLAEGWKPKASASS
jgi:EAL domain-containing protein (putative c-di-GMP-specific phosphodiesterase class I)